MNEQQKLVVRITPAIAQRWLAQTKTLNRTLKEAKIVEYAGIMSEDDWALNGETIKLDVDGEVMDGQHRLHACIRSGMPFVSYVITGLPRAVFDTIDMGTKRTVGDALGMRGIKNCNVVAGAARWVYAYQKKQLKNQRKLNFPAPQVFEFIRKDQEKYEESAAWGMKARAHLGPTTGAALHYLFAKVDREGADSFMHDLATGADLKKSDAILALRKKLLDNRNAKYRAGPDEVFAWCVTAWNRRRGGLDTKVLKGTSRRPFANGTRVDAPSPQGEFLYPKIA